jgi:amino-acid N-acetyltransferase
MLRKARVHDIKQIQELINSFAKLDLMLPRSLNEVYESIRDFWVFEEAGRIVGCAALHIAWDDLAELKSVAVSETSQKQGVGKRLVESCLSDAVELGAKRVFVLTYKPEYFSRFGFQKVEHGTLPHKVWAECINCCKFPDCEEIAMVKAL